MQHQTLPDQYRVTFDLMAGIEPLTFPAATTTDQVAYQVSRAFLVADVTRPGDDVDVAIDVEAGTVTVSVDGDVLEHGSITRVDEQPPAKPDYWLTLAEDLRQVAGRLATLAGTERKPEHCFLSFMVAGPGNLNPAAAELVDTIAKAFGVEAQTGPSGTGLYEHETKQTFGDLKFKAYAYIPVPEDTEKATMRAELETLRAQLAAGGTR